MQSMNSSDDLKNLLAKSRDSFGTVMLDCSSENDSELIRRVTFKNLATPSGSLLVQSTGPKPSESDGIRGGLQVVHTSRIWWRRPSCSREDFSYVSGGTVISIACGVEASSYFSWLNVVYTTRPPFGWVEQLRSSLPQQRGPDPRTIAGRVQRMILLSGSFATAGWELNGIGKQTHCGRDGVLVQAKWMGPGEAPTDSPFIHEYHLIADRERGVLLSCAGMLDGQRATVVSVSSIEFDVAIPDSVFSFEPPAGTKIVWHRHSAA
jgi:hypothetical protein